MRRLAVYCAVAIAALAAASAAFAGPEHRQLGAHKHGHGTFNIAVDGERVTIELEVPGADIVGFEHEARSEDQKAQLKGAREKLAAGLSLFRLPNEASCQPVDTNIEHTTGDHGDGDADHHDDHDDTHHGAHEYRHGAYAGHAEFRVTYSIKCATPAALTAITFDYFKVFEKAERLEVNVVTEKGQSTFEASRDKPVLSLAGLM